MSRLSKDIMQGLEEALSYATGNRSKATERKVYIEEVKIYSPEEVKHIRKLTRLSQCLFAAYLGVSKKTVEAWEAGYNHPSGAASRLLSMIETNPNIIHEYKFVDVSVSK